MTRAPFDRLAGNAISHQTSVKGHLLKANALPRLNVKFQNTARTAKIAQAFLHRSYTGYRHYTVSQKNCAKLLLWELSQISTNFDNFWQKDGKRDEIMRGALISNLI